MKQRLNIGDRVRWKSHVGRDQGIVKKKITSAITFKNGIVRASRKEPLYLTKSDKTDLMTLHKSAELKKIIGSIRSSRARSAPSMKK
jgi:hypothetical protein